MHSPQPQQGSFSLFPNTSSSNPPQSNAEKQPRRRSGSQEHRDPTPAGYRAGTPDHVICTPPQASSPSRHGRRTPPQKMQTAVQTQLPQNQIEPPQESDTPANWPLSDQAPLQQTVNTHPGPVSVQQPCVVHDAPGRTETAFSEASTLFPSNSGRSRSSIAKVPLNDGTAVSGSVPGALRSIFPTYNANLPLAQQQYVPTQPGPSHIPRAVISRQSVYEEPESPSTGSYTGDNAHPGSSHARPAARGRWPLRIQTQPPPVTPTPCTNAELKSLWRVANGWQASASEGRVFCLKLSQQNDAPVYTLSSNTSHPFWNLRLDPTSASAYVKLTRHDPSKPYKVPKTDVIPPSPDNPSDRSSATTVTQSSDTKHWYEALTTTLEEESRKHPPNDGLVALLMPSVATRMAVEKANDPTSVAAAENECARLVWDEDSATYYLVHNALANPFCVTIERHPAYSRIEYTLEHNESSKHIAKLTKDGTGGGWVELDTGVASQIASCYILDVVVASLLLVAAADDRNSPAPMETFAPPPLAFLGEAKRESSVTSRLAKLSVRRDEDKKKKKEKKKLGRKIEGFEIDVESQNDSPGKDRRESWSRDDRLPFFIRVVVKLAKGLFALGIWTLTVLIKCVGVVFKVFYKCVGSKY